MRFKVAVMEQIVTTYMVSAANSDRAREVAEVYHAQGFPEPIDRQVEERDFLVGPEERESLAAHLIRDMVATIRRSDPVRLPALVSCYIGEALPPSATPDQMRAALLQHAWEECVRLGIDQREVGL